MTDMENKWGFLREDEEKARKAGIDEDTKLNRTGLDTYLNKIFPDKTWIHDKTIKDAQDKNIIHKGNKILIRPDYRCEELKLIVEFDGLQHYTDPSVIEKDIKNTIIYQELGYNVIRIPFFIQLTTEVANELFNTNIGEKLFPAEYPSMGPKGKNTPAFMCPRGLKRMAEEFKKFPKQYEVNIKSLKAYEALHPDEAYLTESQLLIDEYNKL